MTAVANHAYASVWTKGYSEETMLGQFEALLDTVACSEQSPGFSGLVIRAVQPTEAPVVEHDLRLRQVTSAALLEGTREHLHADSCYEVAAHWDLWEYDPARALWQVRPQRLEILCFGEAYDDGAFHQAGHFQVDFGFEHLFTGHAGLLGFSGRPVAAPQHQQEATFLDMMSQPGKLREYHEKTRENIRKLLEWMRRIEAALPLEQFRLWSEGEENFEARLDEIVAAR